MKNPLRAVAHAAACSLAALTLAMAAVPAQAQHHGGGYRSGGAYHGGGGYRYYRGGRYWGPGWAIGGIGLGIGLGAAAYYGPWSPGYVVVPGSTVVYDDGPLPVQPAAGPVPSQGQPQGPDPVVYPRNGQTAEQTENDRQACNRWAATQPAAMADASVFHRATIACLEGRGYTVR